MQPGFPDYLLKHILFVFQSNVAGYVSNNTICYGLESTVFPIYKG